MSENSTLSELENHRPCFQRHLALELSKTHCTGSNNNRKHHFFNKDFFSYLQYDTILVMTKFIFKITSHYPLNHKIDTVYKPTQFSDFMHIVFKFGLVKAKA